MTAFTFRATPGPPVGGKDSWYGEARATADEQWQAVKNANGFPILYMTPEYARTAAREFRDRLWTPKNIAEAMKLLEQVMTGPGILPSARDKVFEAHKLLREHVSAESYVRSIP